MKRIYIGLDIGGTKTMIASFNQEGIILQRSIFSTPADLHTGLDLIHSHIIELSAGSKLAGIGAAIGGPLDFQTGIVSPLHQPSWRDVPLKEIMQSRHQVPFYVDVDTNVAALAEYAACSQKPDSLLYITISTGMGGGFIRDGKIYRGSGQSHPEIAHQAVNYRCAYPENIFCECGVVDCLEALVSGNGIERIYGKPAKDLTKREWKEVGYNLGQGLRNITAILSPQEIRLGGGVVIKGSALLLETALETLKEHTLLVPLPHVSISTLGYDTALIGAGLIARNGI
jgi:glucokinase